MFSPIFPGAWFVCIAKRTHIHRCLPRSTWERRRDTLARTSELQLDLALTFYFLSLFYSFIHLHVRPGSLLTSTVSAITHKGIQPEQVFSLRQCTETWHCSGMANSCPDCVTFLLTYFQLSVSVRLSLVFLPTYAHTHNMCLICPAHNISRTYWAA